MSKRLIKHILVSAISPIEVGTALWGNMGWKNSVAINLGFWLYLLAGGEVYFHIENSAYLQPNPKRRKYSFICLVLIYYCYVYITCRLLSGREKPL